MGKKKLWISGFLAAVLITAGVGLGIWWMQRTDSTSGIEFVIGVSQANMRESWRLALVDEIEAAAAEYSNVRLIMTDATSDGEKQEKDVEKLQEFGIDLLIISPCEGERITETIGRVYEKIPVIVMDRAVEGFDYTLFIGPDNELIGRQAGESAVQLLGSSRGKVLELCGRPDSQSGQKRSKGFESIMSRYSRIRTEQLYVESEGRDEAEELILRNEGRLKNIDVIFAHNDYMALGVANALDKLKMDIEIIGIDGFKGENEGIDLVRQGRIAETITCPTGGQEAVRYAMDILGAVDGVPKQIILRSFPVTADNIDETDRWSRYKKTDEGKITVGYSQIGTESGWRLANTKSIKSAAKAAGIELLMEDANQSQENQIKAIRGFIKKQVDVIVITPVIDSGWDDILNEVKAAGIPVILSDRSVEVKEDNLYLTFLGADVIEEGRRAARWITKQVPYEEDTIEIMQLEGTIGSSSAIERQIGFEETISEYEGYDIAYSACGDFTYEGGRDVVEEYLRNNTWDIDVIFAQNDDMALGAVECLEENGIRAGQDVKIVSVDGTKAAFEALQKGSLNCVVECNPLLGPQLMKAVLDLMDGKELPLRIITDERVYDQSNVDKFIHDRKY